MDFSQPHVCLDTLDSLNLSNISEAHRTFSQMISALNMADITPGAQLEVLEACREPLDFVQKNYAQRYSRRTAVPPGSPEDQILNRVVTLWQLMAKSYAHVLRGAIAHADMEEQLPLMAQRRVFYASQPIKEFFRAHRQLPPYCWSDLHASFSFAEAHNVAQTRAIDDLNEIWRAQSASEAFTTILLIDLSNPYGRTHRELEWVFRWAERFAPYCRLTAVETPEQQNILKNTSYGLLLGTDNGLKPLGTLAHNQTLRFFDSNKLAEQFQAVLEQFKQGVKPSALGLGQDCSLSSGVRLLRSLYRPWGRGSAGRRFPRKPLSGMLEIVNDWDAIGFYISGKYFVPPAPSEKIHSFRSDISLLTFGEQIAHSNGYQTPADKLTAQTAPDNKVLCERWQLMDQSIGGFRVMHTRFSDRFEHHQLIAVRPPDSKSFFLGCIGWLMYHDSKGLVEAGVSLLSGVPQMVGIRKIDRDIKHPYQQAFLLPDIPAIEQPASLVLPTGWFQHLRTVEIKNGKKTMHCQLIQLLRRGANFDQASYTLVDAETLTGVELEKAH